MIWVYIAGGLVAGGAMGWCARELIYRRRRSVHPAIQAPELTLQDAPTSPARTVTEHDSEVSAVPSRPDLSRGATTAQRIIVHLASLGRLSDDDVALHGHTQSGMCEALEMRQGTLAKALSRLEAADVVRVDRRHVRGAQSRLKVYRLTFLGESVAREIQRRAADPLDGGRQGVR